MTKGYLSQLIKTKIKSPGGQKLAGLPHSALGLDYPLKQKITGWCSGKFYPLHTGHIYPDPAGVTAVDELHVILCHDEPRDKALFINSSMSQQTDRR